MTSRAQELAKLLGRKNTPYTFSAPSSFTQDSTTETGIWRYVYPAAGALLIIFLVLIIVHYTITPIFTFKFGDKGLFSLAETNDGQLVWKSGPVPASQPAGIKKLIPNGFTLQQDIVVKPSTSTGKVTRVFSYRASQPVSVNMNPNTEDLITQYGETNLLMYIAPDTNDLTVSVITGNADSYRIESAPTMLNVPVGQPFRITVVLMFNVLEVYLNGKLFGTKTLIQKPRGSSADFYGPPNGIRETVTTMNLVYWDRPLTSGEIANAPPPFPSTSLFGPMPGAECLSQGAQSLMDQAEATAESLQNQATQAALAVQAGAGQAAQTIQSIAI